MAPIRVKWDPEILADGFVPSSIFDEVAQNITGPVNMTVSPANNFTLGLETLVEGAVRKVADFATSSTTMSSTTAPVDVAESTVSPAVSSTAGLSDLVREAVRQVVAIATNSTPAPATMSSPPSWATTTLTTIPKRTVERTALQPEVVAVQVRIIFF